MHLSQYGQIMKHPKALTQPSLTNYLNSHLGKRFDLLYVSNGTATRILLNTSNFVEHLLYNINDNKYSLLSKKQVNHVILRLSNLLFNNTFGKENDFVIDINPMTMEDMTDINNVMVLAILRGMTWAIIIVVSSFIGCDYLKKKIIKIL